MFSSKRNVDSETHQSRIMGYSIEKIGKTRRGPTIFWSGVVTIWCDTRVGLNREIDRFIEEEQPKSLIHMSRELLPSFHKPTSKKVGRWEVRLEFGGMKD